MDIAVIIPCFNNSDLVRETLDSVKNQSYPSWECIVVDDGSTDNSLAIIEEYSLKDSRFRVFSRPDNLPKGANSCRNFGVEKCESQLLIFLDADDLLSSNCIHERLSSIKNEDLIIFQTAKFEKNIEDSYPFSSALNTSQTAEHFRNQFLNYSIPWHISSGVWKRDFFKNIGGFDVSLLRFQDVDLHVRALNNPSITLKIDTGMHFTSYYRKSAFHQKVTLEKRRFILNQGLTYVSKMKRLLTHSDFTNLEGLFLYLLFRFEEVIYDSDLNEIRSLIHNESSQNKRGFNSLELKSMFTLYRSFLTKPSRLRKYLSFAIYKKYQFSSNRIGIS